MAATLPERLDTITREASSVLEVAQDVAGRYARVTTLVGVTKIAGVTTLVTVLLAPLGFVIAVLLIPFWPWVFLLPALLVAAAIAAAAVVTWTLGRGLPRSVRDFAQSIRAAKDHVMDRVNGAS
jgi:hypothetical protein